MEGSGFDPVVLLRVAAFPFESLESLCAGPSLDRLREVLDLEDQFEADIAALSEALHRAAGPPVPSDPGRQRARLKIVKLRRDVFNRRPLAASPGDRPPSSSPADDAAPALDSAVRGRLQRYVDHHQRRHALERTWREAFVADRRASRAALLALAAAPRFREGIRLASGALFQALAPLPAVDPNHWDYDERHIASKVAAYAARGAAKTSPHSVFCATALVRLASGPATVSGVNEPVRDDIVLNVFEARKVTSCLAAEPALRAAATLRANPTLREAAEGWSYWKPALLRRPTDEEVLSRVKDLPVLRMFLQELSDGPRAADEVLRAVEQRSGAGASDLARFLEDLVQAGILVWEVEIPYNCRRPLRALARLGRDAGCDTPALEEPEEIEREIDRLPGLASDERIGKLEDIRRRLEALPHVRALKPDELVRLDAASGLEVSLPRSILAEVQEAVDWYARLFATLYPEALLRAGYVKRFLGAHPADRDIPLLDLYHGLFEPEALVRPSAFPGPAGALGGEATDAARFRFARALSAFERLARQAETDGRDEVTLTSEHWHEILGDAPAPRWFCGVLFQVAAARAEDVTGSRTRLVLNGLFIGSGMASARLDHLHGGALPEGRIAPSSAGPAARRAEGPIARDVKKGWSRLERPGAVLAEVTYMHWGRTANAGLRPSLFPYEIELPGEKASEGARVIPLRDLVVRYDSAAERFVLRWLPSGLEVIPVIGSGISPEGFVSFLVSLGQQGFQPLAYFPGFEAEGITAWPRFTSGRTVLFRRRWMLPAESLPGPLTDASFPEAAAFAALARLRRLHRLPRHVFVHTSVDPKPFYADLESPVLADLVRRAVTAREGRPRPSLTFTEMLPAPEELWVRDARGRYASEFLAQLHGPVPLHGQAEPLESAS